MAYLLLEDGTMFEGTPFGQAGQSMGEVVFHTGMTGYQEAITDPSYYGQILVMTYPLIGNCGIANQDAQSDAVQIRALIVHELCQQPSNWQNQMTLEEYCKRSGVGGLFGVDTRALVRHIRTKGTMRARIVDDQPGVGWRQAFLQDKPQDSIAAVTCKKPYALPGPGKQIAVLDLGMKQGILQALLDRGCGLKVFPAYTGAAQILASGCAGVVCTGGPGNPNDYDELTRTVSELMQHMPVLGIGMGHQLMALAQGAVVEKLKTGHRGANQPVMEVETGRLIITSQNHGYAVVAASLGKGARVTHVNWNDQTVEGIGYAQNACMGVQFLPEMGVGAQHACIIDAFLQNVPPPAPQGVAVYAQAEVAFGF